MLANRFNEDGRDLTPGVGFILEEGVGVGIEPVLVVGFVGEGVVDQHVHGEQIHHCLLPRDRPVWVYQLHSVQPVILHATLRALVRHETLSGYPI